MKVFPNLEVALSEIQRDLKKSPVMEVTRVQQRMGSRTTSYHLFP